FFFSSRRRHTRFSRDWSSDVCSSDLWSGTLRGGSSAAGPWHGSEASMGPPLFRGGHQRGKILVATPGPVRFCPACGSGRIDIARSEERRVGKECTCRRWAQHWKKNRQ